MCFASSHLAPTRSNLEDIASTSNKPKKSNKDLNLSAGEEDTSTIVLPYFLENCSFLQTILMPIRLRLLTALGLDVRNPRAALDWPTFLELYSLIETQSSSSGKGKKGSGGGGLLSSPYSTGMGSVVPDRVVSFWVKVFD
jgi:hypothetical protein